MLTKISMIISKRYLNMVAAKLLSLHSYSTLVEINSGVIR